MKNGLLIILLFIALSACQEKNKTQDLFRLLDPVSSGMDFTNALSYTNDFNVYKYRNFYNGGGVGLGDVNGDGLIDIYMIANQSSNKLFINKGDLTFEDVTDLAQVGGTKSWSTGVAIADVNNDGLLDIYVCNSGDIKGDNKENELFINLGNLKFSEEAEKFGLNDMGYTTHASFFDYDRDGDLDAYILNNSFKAIGSFNLRKNERPKRDELGGDKLMENRDGVFVDVSEQAGIYGSVIGFGLGVTVSDFNNDEWPDIFVSNDFFERDYLYINGQDGTFDEQLVDQINSISAASMGADAADIDNDGYAEIFVTDMLPSEYDRLKSVTTFDDWNRYQYNLKNGYHHQFTRNVLQKNNGNGSFSEVSRMAGVDASDWSWGALFFDMDNDGLKDLFIANGIYKDLTNQDYLQYIANESVIESIVSEEGIDYKELIDIIPSNMVKNHAYKNKGSMQFENFENVGLQMESFSNGSAYGDLDNDGDLDLVVNNINMQSFIYENTLSADSTHYLKLQLSGSESNKYGVGCKVIVEQDRSKYTYEIYPTRGFQSSMDPRPNIGLPESTQINVKVIWPSGKMNEVNNVTLNETLVVKESEALASVKENGNRNVNRFEVQKSTIDYFKGENNYSDFNRERLIYQMRSNEGGKMAIGDLNNDGLDDIVFPGAKGFETEIYLNINQDNFKKLSNEAFAKVKEAEHVRALIFDVDGDGDNDIYLASGGVELSEYSEYLYDHIFLNDGQADFSRMVQKPSNIRMKISTGAATNADVDNDGDQDLFVGERIKIGKFGAKGRGYFLKNDGLGNYSVGQQIEDLGMITDASFSDFDSDGDEDLIICGEFMPIEIYENNDGHFTKVESISNLPISGWWNDLHVFDADGDGDMDVAAGNLGLNSRFKASKKQPIKLYFADFDENGYPEGVMTFTADNGRDYPYSLRHTLIDQMKHLKKKFPDFESFQSADMEQIFTQDELSKATLSETDQLNSIVLINNGDFKFEIRVLPPDAQMSPVYSIESADVDQDGDLDLFLGGNQFYVLPEVGIYDGSFGVFLENNGKGEFDFSSSKSLGVKGEIRDMAWMQDQLLINRSRDTLMRLKYIR